ncbi:hypothetical protein BDW59DRAFT_160198 [Aspergillus cavernicola]|uniref:RBR-type E3 ubiquitin transferase n=1 Tax=Aspergillus cavernicola TaxID=176166 RepID=A0ABR4IIH9_9EURO
MSRIRKFLGVGDSGTFYSIYTPPPPKERKENSSSSSKTTKKSRSISIFRIPQGVERTITASSITTASITSAPSQREESIAELPSPDRGIPELGGEGRGISELAAAADTEVSELETRIKVGGRDGGGDEGDRQDDEEREKERNEDDSHKSIAESTVAEVDADLLIFSDMADTTDAIPLFGRQFGIAPTSIIREQKLKELETEKAAPTKEKGCEAFFQQVDDELEALYTDYLKASGKQKQTQSSGQESTNVGKSSRSRSGADACIICLESFSGPVTAPDSISIACQHPTSVCSTCLAKSIKHDLETKFWDEIKCPECKTLLIHENIERFADKETFTRYDRLSFRHAVSSDKNFIWCLGCDFGQLHDQGASQPMVRCLNCSIVSCFKHSIKWHDGFTCDEYDAVLWDPDSYKTIKAKNSNNTAAEPGYMSRGTMKRAKKIEETRQKKLHEVQKDATRLEQEKVAAQVRAERKEEDAKKENKDDFREKLEMLKRRMREVELSVSMVEKTTKRCPGCQWPIEKNEGCDHMTLAGD